MHHPLTLCHVGIFLNESPVPRHSFASRTRDKAYGSICRRFTEYPELLHPHTYARMNARDSVWEDRLRYVGNVGPCTPAVRAIARMHVCGVPGLPVFQAVKRGDLSGEGQGGTSAESTGRPARRSYAHRTFPKTHADREAQRSSPERQCRTIVGNPVDNLSISVDKYPTETKNGLQKQGGCR